MNAVFLLVPGLASLEPVASAIRSEGLRAIVAPGARLRIADEDDHVWAFLETDPHEAPSEFATELGPNGSAPHGVLVIEYSSMALLHSVLKALAARDDVTVNNDHGTTLSGREFLAKMGADPSWDWRRDVDRGNSDP